jgi:hypothetical protein
VAALYFNFHFNPENRIYQKNPNILTSPFLNSFFLYS